MGSPSVPNESVGCSPVLLKATASCETGKKPTVKATPADNVTVLGKPVPVNGPGDQHLEVPGVGTVDLVLENATTTDSTGAAIAFRLKYTVTPAKLGVVKASGEIVPAEATCAMPDGSGAAHEGSASDGSSGHGSDGDGSGSGVAVYLMRRRRTTPNN
ncbi:hypothetical protein [Streptomyces sp. NBC_00286]|uniref:hypothetical protein n=1 Tax=Streptomyces sp. NBC_00286 TaxID=2975701 RepID=UPI002E2CBA31|nr:hypothetical protein [Streptomyces sp. NBC_00286]